MIPALLYQQLGQRLGETLDAGVGLGAQPVQVTALSQQVGQLPGGVLIAGVSQCTQPVLITALNQQVGKPPGGILVAGVGPGAPDLHGHVQVTRVRADASKPARDAMGGL